MNQRKAFEHTLLVDRIATRFAKSKTFSEARTGLMDYLAKEGWKLSDRSLKVPHATSPDGDLRIWFKPQAIWFSVGGRHNLQGARSIHTDIRHTEPVKVVEEARRYAEHD